ncbi:hypothetical protein KJ903_01630 [Patescibacteria group bacterium]|nr:hypothetical protein [Patescibacteria group bacterium]
METRDGGGVQVGTGLHQMLVMSKDGTSAAHDNIEVEGFSAGADSEEVTLGEPVRGSRLIGRLKSTGQRFVSEPLTDPSPWLTRTYSRMFSD